MNGDFPVALILIVGALFVPVLQRRARAVLTLVLPLITFAVVLALPYGVHGHVDFLGGHLVLMRVDKLSLLFSYVFLLATFFAAIYALHEDDAAQQAGTLVYAGSALGAIFAGDLLTLFVFLEIAAVSSVILIWARRTKASFSAGMRYLVVQLAAGMLILAGIAVRVAAGEGLTFEHIGLDGSGGWLILLGLGIKCAFPLLHNWLQDAYPEATATGTVVLSAFTSKIGIYALARGFAGEDMLIYVGTAMAAFPIFYAVIENDLRRVLAYSMNNQLGFMVVGVGIGSELALNGAVAHAFADILFKGLLFMSMGAVLFRTGTVKGSELGGLYKSMPWTTGFCIVGAASISAFPLFSGFVTKSMIMSAAAGEGYLVVWLVLLFASAGVFHHAGIKIPYFAFFAHDSGIRCREAPTSMLIAMGAAAAMCIGIGCAPGLFYQLLPFAVDYAPYTPTHILDQVQLLVFSALAFAVLMRTGIYPPELKSVNLDSDWAYRRLLPAITAMIERAYQFAASATASCFALMAQGAAHRFMAVHRSGGVFARTWTTGGTALWMMILLLIYLLAHLV